ncbi:MAG: hypothetical protein AAF713_17600 [Pseudomonadota bacterium]
MPTASAAANLLETGEAVKLLMVGHCSLGCGLGIIAARKSPHLVERVVVAHTRPAMESLICRRLIPFPAQFDTPPMLESTDIAAPIDAPILAGPERPLPRV